MELTAAFWLAPEGGYVACLDEIPSVMTQGETLDEARANLEDAFRLVIEARRAESARRFAPGVSFRERISVEVPDPDLSA